MKTLKKWDELAIGGIIEEPGCSHEYVTGGWRTFKPVIDLDKCIQCMFCWVYCPDTAVILEEGKVARFDYDHCKGCGICAHECPPKASAITMVAEGCDID